MRLSWDAVAGVMDEEDDDAGEGNAPAVSSNENSVVIFSVGDETPKIRRVTFRRTEVREGVALRALGGQGAAEATARARTRAPCASLAPLRRARAGAADPAARPPPARRRSP